MTTYTAPVPFTTTSGILDALVNLNSETDRWHLAEALLADVPQNSGNHVFEKIVDDATNAGVPALSVTSLRQYRDTAARWPKSERVEGASFTAHREVQGLGITEGADLLRDLIKQHGAKGVTTSAVRKAIAVKQGTTAAARPTPPALTWADILSGGGAKLLAAVKAAGLDAAGLDKVHASLSTVLQEVEAQQMRASRKNAGAKAKGQAKGAARVASGPVAGKSPVVPVVKEAEVAVEKAAEGEKVAAAAGDLRGL